MVLQFFRRKVRKASAVILLFAVFSTQDAYGVVSAVDSPEPSSPPVSGQRGKNLPPPDSLLDIVSYADLFYPHGRFISEVIIPSETLYFQPGIGIDPKSAMPYDHVRIRLDKGQLGERGNYTAASKLALSIPYLLGVMKRKPIFEKAALSPEAAQDLLGQSLKTLYRYDIEYPEYEGFFAWSDIRPNGSISPATTKVPSLDNGQLSWALASVVASFEKSGNKKEKALAAIAQKILARQDYKQFYNEKKKILHGTIQFDPVANTWSGDNSYFLNDMFEGTLAVLWGVLHGQIPEEAWENLSIPTCEYITEKGEVITTFKGHRASFHEHWGLLYLPILRSSLAPLYQNYLYVQADFARRHRLPGFLSTAYDPRGTYRQMGLPYMASHPVDRSDVAVVFATAMGILISPQTGAHWLKNIYTFRGVQTPQGAVESVGHDGYSDIVTADGKGLTILSISGGVIPEIESYLKTRKFAGTQMTLYIKLMELLEAKHKQMMKERKNEPVHMPTRPYPKPAEQQIEVKSIRLEQAGDEFNITEHLQAGHLHGKNTRSGDSFSLEDDIRPGQDIVFDFDVPAYYPYFDQWAFRGTYIDKAIGVSGMKYLTVSIPADTPPAKFDLELKSDDITLGSATIDTMQTPAEMSKDGHWKIFAEPIHIIPEADYKPFNYFSVTVHDPSYLAGEYAKYGREGEVRLRNIFVTRVHPFEKDKKEPVKNEKKYTVEDVELLRFWRVVHGNIQYSKDEDTDIFTFPGGRGWKGGYLPYIVIENYRYLHIRLRNLSDSCNCVNLEINNEDFPLLQRKKIPIKMPANDRWYIYEIPIPSDIKIPLNYLAVSDPLGTFELSSISFSEMTWQGADEVIAVDSNTRLKCTSACQKAKL